MAGGSGAWVEVERLSAELNKAAAKKPIQAARIHRSSTFALQNEMMNRAPVDTGFLRGGVTVEFSGGYLSAGGLRSYTGPTADYAPYVNDGTSRTPPNPFVTDAANHIQPQYIAAIAALSDPFGNES